MSRRGSTGAWITIIVVVLILIALYLAIQFVMGIFK